MSKLQEERLAKYLATFNTPHGKWVLEDLEKKFANKFGMGSDKADGITRGLIMAKQVGEYGVIEHIVKQLEKGEK